MTQMPPRGSAWLRRCMVRVGDVREVIEGELWIVEGRRELGDQDRRYFVFRRIVKGREVFTCTCQDPAKRFSSRRSRLTCSHIGAVLIYRRMKENAGLRNTSA